MSTSIMQAMACGLPIVASDIPGINSLLNGETGVLVTQEMSAFTKAISVLVISKEASCAMRERARVYAESHFSSKRMFEEYNSLVEKMF